MPRLLIYTPKVTRRVDYIFQLFFDTLIKTPFSITSDEGAFRQYTGPKINYSTISFSEKDLQITPCGLLAETGIKPQSIQVSEWNNLKVFFATSNGNFPFDIFSASFYLVSRYEEYFSTKPDQHSRFHHSNSLAFKHNFLDEPLINLWAEELKKIILSKHPSIIFSENKYFFLPTVDIDIAYAHLGRNIGLTLGSYFKALSKFNFKLLIEKKLVLLGLKKDPFDTFDYQETLFKKYKMRPIYFFLAGKRGHNDKNISPDNSHFKKLVNKLSSFADIGIHPSYHSESDPKTVAEEIGNVERNMSQKITCSRQHFLRLNLPETYRCLAELGITDDYTMIYAGVTGFRASICTPFFFYDLKGENIIPVKVHSSAVMDGTLNSYLHMPVPDAIIATKEIQKKVKKCGGEFIVIWHNDNLSEKGQWKGWRTYFENILQAAT
ncbi:MAG TPA: polysaccharide deacetylase family protein [Bacteroidia bacterium]|nr:polysaccharide deacetylase family protein [Bacteroidia bacterium]